MLEIHITVESENFENFRKACETMAIKPLWIQNEKPDGTNERHLLCACTYSQSSSISLAQELMHQLSVGFENMGLPVIREKIECPVGNAPETWVYHECHIKLVLPETDTERVLAFCLKNGISASWSLIRKTVSDRKWYLTVRDYKSSPQEAKAKFIQTIQLVNDAFGQIAGFEMETAIVDSNKDLDKDWA